MSSDDYIVPIVNRPHMSANCSFQLDDLIIPTIPVYVVTDTDSRLHSMEDVLGYVFDRMDRTGETVCFGCFRMKGG